MYIVYGKQQSIQQFVSFRLFCFWGVGRRVEEEDEESIKEAAKYVIEISISLAFLLRNINKNKMRRY